MEEVWKNIDAAIESGEMELGKALKTAEMLINKEEACGIRGCLAAMCPSCKQFSGEFCAGRKDKKYFMAEFIQRYSPIEIEAPPEEQSEMIRDSQEGEFNESGQKYLRWYIGEGEDGKIRRFKMDFYRIAEALDIKGGPHYHALKKVCFMGDRGKGDIAQDAKEASDALQRFVQMQEENKKIEGGR